MSVTTGGLSDSKSSRTHILVSESPLVSNDGDLVDFTDIGEEKLRIPPLERPVGTVEYSEDLDRRVFFHTLDDVEHLWDTKPMFRKHCPCEIIEYALRVLTVIALGVLSYHSLLDRVRTARVRGRVSPSDHRCSRRHSK
jgi:hypothetical protein